MTRPAEAPGTPLEPTGNGRPREMVTHDRIRLTGLLPKSTGNGAFLRVDVTPVHHQQPTATSRNSLSRKDQRSRRLQANDRWQERIHGARRDNDAGDDR